MPVDGDAVPAKNENESIREAASQVGPYCMQFVMVWSSSSHVEVGRCVGQGRLGPTVLVYRNGLGPSSYLTTVNIK